MLNSDHRKCWAVNHCWGVEKEQQNNSWKLVISMKRREGGDEGAAKCELNTAERRRGREGAAEWE